ncbi:MAG: hypothetical protein ACRDGA_11030 [Bacteroidota bacterium]
MTSHISSIGYLENNGKQTKVSELLKRADQLIKIGELEYAAKELASAKELDPQNAYVRAFEERLDHLRLERAGYVQNGEQLQHGGNSHAMKSSPHRLRKTVQDIVNGIDKLVVLKKWDQALQDVTLAREIDPVNKDLRQLETRLRDLQEEDRRMKQIEDAKHRTPTPEEPRKEQLTTGKNTTVARVSRAAAVVSQTRVIRPPSKEKPAPEQKSLQDAGAGDQRSFFQRIDALIKMRDVPGAMEEFEKVKQQDPFNLALPVIQARLASLIEEVRPVRPAEDAPPTVRTTLPTGSRVASNTPSPFNEAIIERFNTLLESKDYQSARAELAKTKQTLPNSTMIRMLEGILASADEQARLARETQQMISQAEDLLRQTEKIRRQSMPSPEPGRNSKDVEAYRKCLEQVWADGTVTPREASLLKTFRDNFRISQGEHDAMEHEVKLKLYTDTLMETWLHCLATAENSEKLSSVREQLKLPGDTTASIAATLRRELAAIAKSSSESLRVATLHQPTAA